MQFPDPSRKFVQTYDDLCVEDINRLTKDAVVCALEMSNEDCVTFPKDDIRGSPALLCLSIGGTGEIRVNILD